MTNRKKMDQPLYALAAMGAFSIQVAIFIVIGYWLGSYVSKITGSKGWLIAGVFLGLALGIGTAIVVVKKMLEDTDG